jgi:type VI secretion system protein ImpK
MGSSANTYPRDPVPVRRTENLAFLFQEPLTVIARLRANRQPIGHPGEFRSDITGWLTKASKEAVSRGYATDDVRFAAYAVVALLDESVLNSNNPAFGDWLSNPLQAQLFGVLLAGENYFRNIEVLLTRPDSQDLADVLEVYLLGLLLGFRGRHSKEDEFGGGPSPALASRSAMRGMKDAIRDKIRRIRGADPGLLAASMMPPPEPPRPVVSAWRRRFLWLSAASWLISIMLFVIAIVVLDKMAGGLPSISAAGQ